VVVAALMGLFGPSIFAARLYACFLTSASAVLVSLLAWRVSKSYYAALLAAMLFAADHYVMCYSCFVCHETFALTWALLMIVLFPRVVASRGHAAVLGYSLLVGLGGWFAWQCFFVPLACCGALLLADRRQLWQRPMAALLPIIVAVLFGAVLTADLARAEAAHQPNNWSEKSETLAKKLALRTGYANRLEALQRVLEHIERVTNSRSFLMLFAFLLLGETFRSRPAGGTETADNEAERRRRAFYLHALWLFPVLWLVAMPQMHRHEFQNIFMVPLVAVGVAHLLAVLFAGCSKNVARWLKLASLGGAVLLLLLVIGFCKRPDNPFLKNMAAEVQKVASPDTPVVMGVENRGLWWRIDRPVVGLTNMHVLEEQHVPYVLLVPREWTAPAGQTFQLLTEKTGFSDPEFDYKILRRQYSSRHQ
jgi:4-amino-4-deoxy-L-arabinose transferase-like glycosyltransferase